MLLMFPAKIALIFQYCSSCYYSSSTTAQSCAQGPNVIHTAQGLQYPGVQDPEQGRPGAR